MNTELITIFNVDGVSETELIFINRVSSSRAPLEIVFQEQR